MFANMGEYMSFLGLVLVCLPLLAVHAKTYSGFERSIEELSAAQALIDAAQSGSDGSQGSYALNRVYDSGRRHGRAMTVGHRHDSTKDVERLHKHKKEYYEQQHYRFYDTCEYTGPDNRCRRIDTVVDVKKERIPIVPAEGSLHARNPFDRAFDTLMHPTSELWDFAQSESTSGAGSFAASVVGLIYGTVMIVPALAVASVIGFVSLIL